MSDSWDDLLWDLGADPSDVKAGGVIDLRHLGKKRASQSGKNKEKPSVFAERAEKAKKVRAKGKVKSEELFMKLWKRYGDKEFGDPISQESLVPGRNFAADFYWPREGVAVEIDGLLGKPSKGSKPDKNTVSRHRSLTGVMKSDRKRNLTLLEDVVVYVVPSWWLRGGYRDLKKERRLLPQDFIFEINKLLRMRRDQRETVKALMKALEEAQAWIVADRNAPDASQKALDVATGIAAVLSEARRVYK